MSARTDAERAEDSRMARIEAAKAKVRIEMAVIAAYADAKTAAETAAGIEMPSGERMSRRTAERLRIWLGLDSGRQWAATGKRMGRLNSRRDIEGVMP